MMSVSVFTANFDQYCGNGSLLDNLTSFSLVNLKTNKTKHYNLCTIIVFQENHAQVQDVGEDLEQVEVMQKKFDDFQSDLKANEVRLAEMNEIAMQLMSLGQTEAALKIQTQLQVCKFIVIYFCIDP